VVPAELDEAPQQGQVVAGGDGAESAQPAVADEAKGAAKAFGQSPSHLRETWRKADIEEDSDDGEWWTDEHTIPREGSFVRVNTDDVFGYDEDTYGKVISVGDRPTKGKRSFGPEITFQVCDTSGRVRSGDDIKREEAFVLQPHTPAKEEP
jgi:hypothetical protein